MSSSPTQQQEQPQENVDPMDVDVENDDKKPAAAKKSSNKSKSKNTSKEVQLPWVEKYRPARLEDLVSQDDIVTMLTNLIDSNNLPHLLLYGPPGTGKTSTIIAAAKRMYASPAEYSRMTLELNASDARGIDVVRNEIKEFAGTKQLFTNTKNAVKLIILDEADSMTNDAQFALRRIIEKYTRTTRFCLICNYVSKIIPALQSRCTRFRFAPLAVEHIRSRLEEVATAENCNVTPNGYDAILNLSNGDMRRVLNLLQSTSMACTTDGSEINESTVYLTAGAPLPADIDSILHLLMNSNFKSAYESIVNTSFAKGYALQDIVTCLTTKLTEMVEGCDPNILGMLLDGMSGVEHRLAYGGCDEKLQIASLVGVFVNARHSVQ